MHCSHSDLLESTPLSTSGVRKLVKSVFDPRQLRPSRADDSWAQTAESGKVRARPRVLPVEPWFSPQLIACTIDSTPEQVPVYLSSCMPI